MWEKLDIAGLANKLNDYFYDDPFNIIIDESRCDHSVVFGTEKTSRDCTYKLVELESCSYAILEDTELKTGSKHMVLLYEKNGAKEQAKYFKVMSSINALNYFADTYVPNEMWESFMDLIKSYENYNREGIAKHKNSDDLIVKLCQKFLHLMLVM